MFSGQNGWVGLVGTALFIIFAYNILKNWNGAVGIENSTAKGAIGLVGALQGK
jgi:hypothetical protein